MNVIMAALPLSGDGELHRMWEQMCHASHESLTRLIHAKVPSPGLREDLGSAIPTLDSFKRELEGTVTIYQTPCTQ